MVYRGRWEWGRRRKHKRDLSWMPPLISPIFVYLRSSLHLRPPHATPHTYTLTIGNTQSLQYVQPQATSSRMVFAQDMKTYISGGFLLSFVKDNSRSSADVCESRYAENRVRPILILISLNVVCLSISGVVSKTIFWGKHRCWIWTYPTKNGNSD